MQQLFDQQLGNYRLLRLSGRGGFADVYLGEHVLLGTLAAIKVHHAMMEGADLERFEREARTIAQLNHPHIVRVLDYGVQDGVAYLVMNYAPYGTLREVHPERSVVPLETVVDYVKQVADALQYAHDKQLVHRDVKPENMLLDTDHKVLLSDFGIAIPACSTASLGTQDAIGTVSYMAPEQLRKKARPASDQYALATIAYEWLAGDPPFDGLPVEVALQHITDPVPPLSDKRPDLPPAVERVLLKALSKEPEQRFPSIWLFAEALAQAAQGKGAEEVPTPALPSSRERSPEGKERPPRMGIGRRTVLITLGVAGCAALGLEIGGVIWQKSGVSPTVARKSQTTVVIPPDTTPSPRQGTFTGIQSVIWSPGGSMYAVANAGGNDAVAEIQVWQRPNRFLWSARYSRIWSLAWSPDDGQIPRLALACDDGPIRIVGALDGHPVSVYTGHGRVAVLSIVWAKGVGDADHIISGVNNGVIHVWSPDNNATRFTVMQSAPVTGLAGGGMFIAAGAQPGGTYNIWDASTGGTMFQFQNDNTVGSDTPANSINRQLTPGTLTAVGWSSDGQFVTVADSNGNVHFLSNIACSCFLHMSAFQAHKAQINAISWDPTGRQFATVGSDGTIQTWGVVIENQTTSRADVKAIHLSTYTNPHGASVQAIAWSPTGDVLLYGDSKGNIGFWKVK